MNTSHMKKLSLFVLLLLHAGKFLVAQTTIVQWNFNNVSTPIPANGMAPAPSLGSGTLSLTGGVTATDVAGVTGSVDPGPNNRALSTSSYPASTNNPQTAGIDISVNTTGYNSIHLNYYSKHSATAANKLVIQYLNGSSGWQSIYSYTASMTTNFFQKDFDLSSVSVVNNSGSVRLRVVTDFATANSYQAAGSGFTYGSSGTIQYDLVTVYGTALGCGTPATQQATGFRLLKTDATSAQLTLNRGNGLGCLVLCSASGVPTVPVNTTNYAASSTYGNGASLGNAYAVYNTQANNPSTHYFNISGLTAGTKYYVAAYEYSRTGYCYLTPGTVDSFYCNSTILYPGDVQFVGYDNNVGTGGRDAFVFSNLKVLTTGTSFQIVNSRYEAGAAANVRTNQWYSGDNDIYQPLRRITLTYTGANLPAGSIISFRHLPGSADSIKINGNPTTAFTITDNLTIGNLLSSTGAEQFFLTQGRFTSYGSTAANNLYSLLEGHVLHGISYTNNWVDFSQACNADTSAASRQSRIPADIKCLNLYFPVPDNFAFYPAGFQHSGSQGFLLGQINNASNWIKGNGTSVNDIDAGVLATQFSLAPPLLTANWKGSTNTNWFNCSNWENLYVPDSTANVTIAANPIAAIDANATFAAEYSSLATTRNLSITNTINLSGNATDKLMVYDSLNIGTTGSLTTSGTATDTVIVRGSIQSQNANALQLSNNGWLSLQGNRQIQPINVSLAGTTPVGVTALSLNNPPGINIGNGGFESLQKLDLANGILSPTTTSAFHYMGAACTISSPANLYNETNKGWEKSYIDGKVFIRTAATIPYTAPLGSKQKGVFAPMIVSPAGNSANIYEAGYVGMSHPNTGPADINTPPVNKVSTQEYWTLISNPINAAANLTLYYTPASFVGGQGNDPQALLDLQIVQYWDSNANSIRKWRLPTVPASTFNSGPNVQYGKISMTPGQYATSLSDPDKNFTLGSASVINTLPVQLITWKASLQGSRPQLAWQANEETGIAFYSVEKSTDAKNYYLLKTIYPAGKSYTCYDDSPADGWNYYRLKITDLSGKISYTAVEKVWLKRTAAFAVFPNPATDKIYISLPGTAKGVLRLYAADGKKYYEQAVTSSFMQLNIKSYAPGWYLLEYSEGKNRFIQKLFVK